MRIIQGLVIWVLLLVLTINPLRSQDFRIEVCIAGLSDTEVILSHRFGLKFFTDDTARTDKEGCCVFQSTALMPSGMYQIVLPDKKYLEFFLDNDQVFSIQTTADSPAEKAVYTGSEENRAFHRWQQKMNQYQSGIAELQGILKKGNLDPDSVSTLNARIRQMQIGSDSLWNASIAELGGSLAGSFIKGLKPLKVPEYLASGSTKQDQLMQYQYFRHHYFDGIDLSDERLLRTPLIETKLDQYFNRVVTPVADSIIHAADQLIKKAGDNSPVYQYLVQYLLNLYSDPKIMGTDAVYVHLAENYYLNGRAPWIDQSNLEAIRTRASELKPLLLGAPAPPLDGLRTPEGNPVLLSNIEAEIVILYFWEPDCGHCKETTPKLFQEYEVLKGKGVETVAINTRPDKDPWTSFINEYKLTWINAYSPEAYHQLIENYQAWSTPKVFILDSGRRIIAKDLSTDQVTPFIDQYLRFSKKN